MTRRWWLLLSFWGCATQTPQEERFEVPDGPLVYRKADCPSTPTKKRTVRPQGRISSAPKLPTLVGGELAGPMVVTHGGAGSKPALKDGPQTAVDKAQVMLDAGQPALEAAVAATVHLEDDGRFNAGTGSNIRLDGKTIQMDASLMTDDGAFAAVAVIERVKNPIQVVRLVLDSPHVLMAGEGATRFAHRLGIKDMVPVSEEAKQKYETRMERLKDLVERPGTTQPDWQAYWNFPGEMPADMKAWRHGGDTVGAVVRDVDGRFAATLSSGGTSVTLYGRVGDVPVYGAGLFAGPHGAVACTGKGEAIIRQGLAKAVYERMASGAPARAAVKDAAHTFEAGASVGIIAVDRFGWGVASNRPMAYGVTSKTP